MIGSNRATAAHQLRPRMIPSRTTTAVLGVLPALLACVVWLCLPCIADARSAGIIRTFGFPPDSSYGLNGIAGATPPAGEAMVGGFSALQSDGKLILAGSEDGNSVSTRGIWAGVVERLNTNGSLDPSFGVGGVSTLSLPDPEAPSQYNYTQITALTVDPQGRILVVGYATGHWWRNEPEHAFALRGFVARLLPNGELDSSFGNGGVTPLVREDPLTTVPGTTDTFLRAIAVAATGKIVVGGTESSICFTAGLEELFNDYVLVARLNANGSLDQGFGSQGVATKIEDGCGEGIPTIQAVAVRPDETVVVAGSHRSVATNGTWYWLVDTISANGLSISLDEPASAVASAGEGIQHAIALPDGRIVLAGMIPPTATVDPRWDTTPDQVAVVRVLPGGALDPSFGINGERDLVLALDSALSLGAEGTLVVGGALWPTGPFALYPGFAWERVSPIGEVVTQIPNPSSAPYYAGATYAYALVSLGVNNENLTTVRDITSAPDGSIIISGDLYTAAQDFGQLVALRFPPYTESRPAPPSDGQEGAVEHRTAGQLLPLSTTHSPQVPTVSPRGKGGVAGVRQGASGGTIHCGKSTCVLVVHVPRAWKLNVKVRSPRGSLATLTAYAWRALHSVTVPLTSLGRRLLQHAGKSMTVRVLIRLSRGHLETRRTSTMLITHDRSR